MFYFLFTQDPNNQAATRNKVSRVLVARVPIRYTNNAIARHLLNSANENVITIRIVKVTSYTANLTAK